MRILIIDNDYPNDDNLYGDVFVHVRVKEYKKKHTCLVVSLTAKKDFVFEGVEVRMAVDSAAANRILADYKPDVLFIHFVLKNMIEEILPKHQVPIYIWVHGFEALAWYRRLFNYSLRAILSRSYLREVQRNLAQLLSLRSLIRQSNVSGNPHFIFVSEWMKNICQADTAMKIKNSSIVPNPIDITLFKYRRKDEELRKHILLIRPFSSRKYATDIAMSAILLLARKPFFADLHFTIVGKGRLFSSQTNQISNFTNVELHNTFLSQKQISEFHASHGIFLCPTRQDAQGVSMCEAMSSGLVPITSNNTAIPEFVEHGVSGFLTNSGNDISDAIEKLFNFPDLFLKMSESASNFIHHRCALEKVTAREMELIANHGDA